MPDYSTFDIIDFTVDERPADVASVFDDLIGQKIVDAIAQKKIEVAQQMFEPQEDDEDDIEYEDDDDSEDYDDDEDFEFDEDELEDLDTEEEEDENS